MCSVFKPRSLRAAAVPAVATLLLCLAATQPRAQTLLLETFERDAIGSAPNGPEIESAMYGTGILIGMAISDYKVVDSDARQWLQPTSLGSIDQPGNGALIEYNPLPSRAARQRVHYEFQVQLGDGGEGINAWAQELAFQPLGVNLSLYWAAASMSHGLVLSSTMPGCCDPLHKLNPTNEPASADAIGWLFGNAADSFSPYLDGAALVSKLAFGAGAQSMRQLAFSSNSTISGNSVIDNVSISAIPEPGSWEVMAGNWALPGGQARHCKPV